MASPDPDRPTGKPFRGPLAALAAAGLGGTLLWSSGQNLLTAWHGNVEAVFGSVEAMRGFVLGFGACAPAVFFLIQVAQVVLAPIPGNVTTVVGALVFGLWEGLALGLAGAVVGSVLVFALGRRWGRPLVVRLVGRAAFEKYAGVFDARGWVLFVVFLLPFLPDDAVCALAGLSAVSFRRFLVLVLVGRLPSTAFTVLVASGAMPSSAALWIATGLVATVVLAATFAYRARLEDLLLRARSSEAGPDGERTSGEVRPSAPGRGDEPRPVLAPTPGGPDPLKFAGGAARAPRPAPASPNRPGFSTGTP